LGKKEGEKVPEGQTVNKKGQGSGQACREKKTKCPTGEGKKKKEKVSFGGYAKGGNHGKKKSSGGKKKKACLELTGVDSEKKRLIVGKGGGEVSAEKGTILGQKGEGSILLLWRKTRMSLFGRKPARSGRKCVPSRGEKKVRTSKRKGGKRTDETDLRREGKPFFPRGKKKTTP